MRKKKTTSSRPKDEGRSSLSQREPVQLNAPGELHEYYGSKWGIYLRAPDIFFKLQHHGNDRLVPVIHVADVRRGVTSGCDAFFFPKDITESALSDVPSSTAFRDRYGIGRNQTDRIRLVKAGDGSVHAVESEYIRPVLFNLMDVDSIQISPSSLPRCIVLVSEPKADLRGTRILRYIQWGERESFHERPTCAARTNWYDCGTGLIADCFWTKSQRYRHIVPINPQEYPCNNNLYAIKGKSGVNSMVISAILNSTVVVLMKHQYGRTMGGDPVLKTEVMDVNMMVVPDPRRITASILQRLNDAFTSMSSRQIHHLVDVDVSDDTVSGELSLEDRLQLDDAVLELLGIDETSHRRLLREELYREITHQYRQVRIAERQMQRFRSQNRHSHPTPHSIAEEIWDSFNPKPAHKSLADFLPERVKLEEIAIPSGKARILKENLFAQDALQVGDSILELGHPQRCEFVMTLIAQGISGKAAIPVDPNVCRKANECYAKFSAELTDRFLIEAGAYTADEVIQDKIVKELWRKTISGACIGSA